MLHLASASRITVDSVYEAAKYGTPTASLLAEEPLHPVASDRCRLIQRAGPVIRPQGQLTLSMSANQAVREELLHYLAALKAARVRQTTGFLQR